LFDANGPYTPPDEVVLEDENKLLPSALRKIIIDFSENLLNLVFLS